MCVCVCVWEGGGGGGGGGRGPMLYVLQKLGRKSSLQHAPFLFALPMKQASTRNLSKYKQLDASIILVTPMYVLL